MASNAPSTLQCQHCKKEFSDNAEFQAHCDWHTDLQKQLQRTGIRQYGMRYKTNRKDPQTSTAMCNLSVNLANQRQSAAVPSSMGAPQPRPDPTSAPLSSASSFVEQDSSEKITFVSLSDALPSANVWKPSAHRQSVRRDEHSAAYNKQQLDWIMRTFPPWQAEGGEREWPRQAEIKCNACEAVFNSVLDHNAHYLSKRCFGSAAVAYILHSDNTVPEGYKIVKRMVNFDGQVCKFKCKKCDKCFDTERAKDLHQGTHSMHIMHCPHCGDQFDTEYELEVHYDDHDDMQFRHERDVARANPQSQGPVKYASWSALYDEDEYLNSTGGMPDGPVEISKRLMPGATGKGWAPLGDRSVVGISFISPEDLERVLAPKGVLQGRGEFYLSVPAGVDPATVRAALDYFGDISTIVTNEMPTANIISLDRDRSKTNTTALRSPPVAPSSPTSYLSPTPAAEKKSRLSKLFGRPKSGDGEKPGGQRTSSSSAVAPRKNATVTKSSTSGMSYDEICDLMTNVEILDKEGNSYAEMKRQQDAALLGIEEAQNHRWKKDASDLKDQGIELKAHRTADGTHFRDASGRERAIPFETVAEIMRCIQDDREAAIARKKMIMYCYRLDAGKKNHDDEDALNSATQALKICDDYPELQIEGLVASLFMHHEAAKLHSKLGHSTEAENSYLDAIKVCHDHHGIWDQNNAMFINELAVELEMQGRIVEAVRLYRRSLVGRIKHLGYEYYDTAITFQELGNLHVRFKQWDVAKKLLERSNAIFEKVAGPHDPFTFSTCMNLCTLYQTLGLEQDVDAILMNRMVPRCNHALAPDDMMTISTLARYLDRLNRLHITDDIRGLVQKCKQVPENAQCREIIHQVGGRYHELGMTAQYQDILRFEWNTAKNISGPRSFMALYKLYTLAVTHMFLDQFPQADQAFSHVIRDAPMNENAENAAQLMQSSRGLLADMRERMTELNNERDFYGDLGHGDRMIFKGNYCKKCNKYGTFFCAVCQTTDYCSPTCRLTDSNHQQTCFPSLTPSASPHAHFHSVVTTAKPIIESSATSLLKSGTVEKRSKMRLHKANCLAVDPGNFLTSRIQLDYRYNCDIIFNADLAERMEGLEFGLLGVPTGDPEGRFVWKKPENQRHFCVLKEKGMVFLVLRNGTKEVRKWRGRLDLARKNGWKYEGQGSAEAGQGKIRAVVGGGDQEDAMPDQELLAFSKQYGHKGGREPLLFIIEWEF